MTSIRVGIIMPVTMRNRLNEHIPERLRSAFIRQSLSMALDAVEEHGSGFVGLMFGDDVCFRPTDRKCQNLAKAVKGKQDEIRNANPKDFSDGL